MSEATNKSDYLTEDELFHRWGKRWERFCSDFDTAVSSETIPELLRDKVKNGNAERAIAGGHEGREVLELLQNARDAIPSDSCGGRVYIGIYEEGVLVANTGSPFDLFDPDVEDAVTMIGESSKEHSEEEIGHKGVGLKSVLATGEAFEIWSQHEAATDDLLRVRLSRAYITATLLATLGYESDAVVKYSDIPNETIQTFASAGTPSNRTTQLNQDAREAIGKIPLFDFPVPLPATPAEPETIASKAADLVTGKTADWYGPAFRTAVFIDYEDEAWNDLLDTFEIPHPDPPERTPAERADQLWSYLSHGTEERGLTAETLIQFGGIDELLLERRDADGCQQRECREVDRTEQSAGGAPIEHEQVTVTVSDDEGVVTGKTFDEFRPVGDESDVQLLVPTDVTEREQLPTYPLYLYYPIENTRDIGLPYSLHGHFVVETNRKDLSLNSLDTNQATLERGIELIGDVAETAATQDLGEQYPWVLLPPVPETYPETPSTQANTLRWFQGKVYEELRDRACVPALTGPDSAVASVQPRNALLHWDRAVRDGFGALYAVSEAIDPTVRTDASLQFLPESALRGSTKLPLAWDDRLEQLLDVDEPTAYSQTVAEAWATVLSATLSQQDADGKSHLICDATIARDLFGGTVETILQSGTDDDELESTLTMVAEPLESVYLLPCRHMDGQEAFETATDSDGTTELATDEETLLLIPVESREGGRTQERGINRSRSVIWDINSPERDAEPPDVPREKSSYQVYFFDRITEQDERARRVLELAGRPWGVRRYDGTPSYFRELLDTFATIDPDRVGPLDFHFLAKQIHKIGSESTDLQTHEGAFLPLTYVEGAVATSDGDKRQNLRRRINLRNNQLVLPRDGGTYAFDDTVLGDDWQKLRARVTNTETDDWGAYDSDAIGAWPGPKADPWKPIAGSIDREDRYHRIAQTLSLFGTGVLPGVRIIWMYGSGHPRPGSNPSWKPTEWAVDDYSRVTTVPNQTTALQRELSESSASYLDWITAPERHPQTSAEHSNKCNVKTDGVLQNVFLATWVWIDDMSPIVELGEDRLLELLQRYETEFGDSLLRTGWACSHGHQRDGYGWSRDVPTLFNWQLRHLPIWDSLVITGPDIQEDWGEDADRLSYAVLKTGAQGARPARLFPHVEAEQTDLPADLLSTLGVKPIGSFDATEAAWHLQRLLDVLATAPLSDETGASDTDVSLQDPIPLDIPEERTNDWNGAYTDLLNPIMNHLPADDASMDDLSLPFLTHLPIKQDGRWVAASLDWIETHAEQGRYYENRSPKPWERQQVEQGGYWLVPQTRSGPYKRLTDALGIERVDASKPVFRPDELSFTDDSVTDLQDQLQNRTALLIASLEQSSDERIKEFAQELETAIAGLRITEEFPDGAELEALIDRQSGLYATGDDTEAFVLNAAAFEESPTLDGLATAVGLLAEQPTKVPVFREVLSPDHSPTELEQRWRQAFPIDTVQRVLGSQRRQRLRRQLDAVSSLTVALDDPIDVSIEAILTEVEQCSDTELDAFDDALANADPSRLSASTDSARVRFTNQLQARLPTALAFVLRRVFGSTRDSWAVLITEAGLDDDTERTVIAWLADHASIVDAASCFPESVRGLHRRVLDVVEVWDRTTTEELTETEIWHSQLESLSTSRSVDWTSTIPDRLHTDEMQDTLLFYYTPEQQYQSRIVSPFLEELEADLPGTADDIVQTLRVYIETGEFPVETSSTSAADYQDTALADLQSASGPEFTSQTILDGNFDVGTAAARTTGQSSGGSGSSQFRGRGQQAEAATLVAILNDTATWLTSDVGNTVRRLRSAFRKLREQEQNRDYMWHVDKVWEQQLDPLISKDILTEEVITDWQSQLAGRQLRNHPLVSLCNVALERGPGYDIIDPFGSLSGSRDQIGVEHFLPVEVKAVDGKTAPYSFRLTTNEYKRAKAFTRGDRSYSIRLVYVPPADREDWIAGTAFVSETVLETPSEVDALVQNQPFEEIVKGGYMNMQITGQ
jgi:hypothetical protein